MSVPYFDLTNMSPEQRAALYKREAGRPVTIHCEDGRIIDSSTIKPEPRVLTKPWPRKGEPLEQVNWASDLAKRTVLRELGRDPTSDDEYMECLVQVGMERGWEIVT